VHFVAFAKEYVPTEQLVHAFGENVPLEEYEPGVQGAVLATQLEAPSADTKKLEHALHETEAIELEYWPDMHALQELDPDVSA